MPGLTPSLFFSLRPILPHLGSPLWRPIFPTNNPRKLGLRSLKKSPPPDGTVQRDLNPEFSLCPGYPPSQFFPLGVSTMALDLGHPKARAPLTKNGTPGNGTNRS